jgi:serine/threonine-protein kinase
MPTPDFPYRILAKIGEGSMGTVYQAVEPTLNRRVAIKVPFTQAAEAFWAPSERHEAHLRFLQEARSAAAIQHPGAVTIHRVGQVADVPYIAMEWLAGEPLAGRLGREGRLPVDAAVGLALQVLDTLQSAHEAGITHRDIKPANSESP